MIFKEYYTISELSKATNITNIRIRTWENRYGFLKPKRTGTNIRVYTANDLKKVLLISHLIEAGEKISAIAHLSVAKLTEKLRAIVNEPSYEVPYSTGFKDCIKNFDEVGFHKQFDTLLKNLSFEEVMEKVLFPMLNNTHRYWLLSELEICQEQFLANLIRQKVVTQIENLPVLKASEVSTILFLPDREQHELGLLYIHYRLRAQGHSAIYLGTGIDPITLPNLISSRNPSYIVTTITSKEHLKSAQHFKKIIVNLSKSSKVILLGDNTILRASVIRTCSGYQEALAEIKI